MNDNLKTSSVGLEEAKLIASVGLCDAFGRTGIGGRKENQDSYAGMTVGNNVILTVCDGMGGMNGGQTASRIAVTEIAQTLAETPIEKLGEEAIFKAVEAANAAIYRRALNDPPLRGMGTTTTVLVLTSEAAYLTHVGDSRIYQLRNGKKEFRTFDHSKVFEMVAQNMMTEEQARQSSFSNIITRALGIRPKVEMTVEKISYKKGDRFILCCDGIWNTLPEPEMMKLFLAKSAAKEEVEYLTETVNGIGEQRGGDHDNLTAIVVDMKKNSTYQYGYLKLACQAIKRQLSRLNKRSGKSQSKA
ncbi:PP2C family protein-serine/threonine phosphatase [Segatella copri]|uniref:PP2C family protein-serine/threonine phosphatase n=1 Tax=Segatella copri TaxID=165179 RepID=UPI003D01B1AB